MPYTDQMKQSIRDSVRKSGFSDAEINRYVEAGNVDLDKILKRANELIELDEEPTEVKSAQFIVMQINTFNKVQKGN